MIASRGIITDISDRLGHAVFEEQAGIISEHRVPDSRFHAHAGSASRDHEIAGIQCLEDVIQSGLIKAAEPSLVKDDVQDESAPESHDHATGRPTHSQFPRADCRSYPKGCCGTYATLLVTIAKEFARHKCYS